MMASGRDGLQAILHDGKKVRTMVALLAHSQLDFDLVSAALHLVPSDPVYGTSSLVACGNDA